MTRGLKKGAGWVWDVVNFAALPLALVLGLIVIGIFVKNAFFSPPEPTRVVSIGPTITQLEKLGDITVLRLTLSDVLVGEAHGYKGAWLVKGDALYSIDMGKAQITSKSEESRIATVLLPSPRVVSPRVDHKRTRTYSVKKNTIIPFTGDQGKLRDECMLEAQALIEAAAASPEYLEVARRNAEFLVANMYKFVDWTVHVEWMEEPSPAPPQDEEE